MRNLSAFLTVVIYLCAFGTHAADIEGSADHALVPRYEGSEIVA